jgi:hypothetical protein
MMTEAYIFFEDNKDHPEQIKAGTLRFYGTWFGKPLDNYHKIVKLNYIELEDCLVFEFDRGEILSIWNAKKISTENNHFSIVDASWVRWTWYDYGKDKTPENLLFIEYYQNKSIITGRSNVDWFTFENLATPAVEIY